MEKYFMKEQTSPTTAALSWDAINDISKWKPDNQII